MPQGRSDYAKEKSMSEEALKKLLANDRGHPPAFNEKKPEASDPRFVYGASCTWWDSIDKVGKLTRTVLGREASVPCCPNCSSVLYEVADESHMMQGLDDYDAKHPGYKAMFLWARGKCFRDWTELRAAYEKEKLSGQENQTKH
jgi:hypothetical protein